MDAPCQLRREQRKNRVFCSANIMPSRPIGVICLWKFFHLVPCTVRRYPGHCADPAAQGVRTCSWLGLSASYVPGCSQGEICAGCPGMAYRLTGQEAQGQSMKRACRTGIYFPFALFSAKRHRLRAHQAHALKGEAPHFCNSFLPPCPRITDREPCPHAELLSAKKGAFEGD